MGICSNATVTNSGALSAAVCDFAVPQGIQGATVITISAPTTFRPTGITDIICTAAGTAGIVTNIGVRMTSKIPGCFRLSSQSGPKPQSGGPQAGN